MSRDLTQLMASRVIAFRVSFGWLLLDMLLVVLRLSPRACTSQVSSMAEGYLLELAALRSIHLSRDLTRRMVFCAALVKCSRTRSRLQVFNGGCLLWRQCAAVLRGVHPWFLGMLFACMLCGAYGTCVGVLWKS